MNILDQIGYKPEKMHLGSACKKEGHVLEDLGLTPRYKSNNYCVFCHRQYTQAHSDRLKVKAQQYRESHEEELRQKRYEKYHADVAASREKGKAYRKANPDAKKAQHQRYREKYRDVLPAMVARYREKNRHTILAQRRKHYKNNKDVLCRRKRENYQKDRDKFLERSRLWIKNHPEAAKIRNRRRIAKKKNVHRLKYSFAELNSHLQSFGLDCKCVYCDKEKGSTLDHFLPISLGGADILSNLVPACRSCNASKYNNDPRDWYKRQPFYKRSRWLKILKVLGKTEQNYNQIPLL